MRLFKVTVFITFLSTQTLFAQSDEYSFYYNNNLPEDSATEISTETELFNIPVPGSNDVFERMSQFNFSAVRYERRGMSDDTRPPVFANTEMVRLLNGRIDYASVSNFSRAGLNYIFHTGTAMAGYSGYGNGAAVYSPNISQIPKRLRASLFTYDRRGRLGVRLSSTGKIGGRADYIVWASRRWGRDAHIHGVFSDETSFLAGIEWRPGIRHRISFFVTGTHSENGTRSYATMEAFDLTGDKLYNPSWGWYDDSRRNARVSNRFQPFIVAAHRYRLSDATTLNTTISVRMGREQYSSPGWFDADTPYPDYYRYMPSYATGTDVYEILTEKWTARDPSATQIDWADMYEINTPAARAVYFLENRVERVTDIKTVAEFRTDIDRRTRLGYGIVLSREDSRYYKTLKDLLGGRPFYDIDQFDGTVNDLSDPNRRVRTGDRFGYDYSLTMVRAGVFAGVYHRAERLNIAANIKLNADRVRRYGHFENAKFPGAGSLGKSKPLNFSPYRFDVYAVYSFTPRHNFTVAGYIAGDSPYAGSIILSPQYSNDFIANPVLKKSIGGEASYSVVLDNFNLKLTGFVAKTSNESSVYRYWDDLSSAYSVLVLSGVSKMFMGVEIGAGFDITSKLSMKVAASEGRYTYESDPTASLYDDGTHRQTVFDAKSYLKGYTVGSSPQRVASAEMRYNNRGWNVAITYNYMGNRYIDATPVRRMSRCYTLAESPERFMDFVSQEKLPDASTLDFMLMKWINLSRRFSMTVMGSVSNIIDKKDNVYNGYEQLRVVRRGADVNRQWLPFPSKYLYNYGRTYYLSVTFNY